MINFNIDTNKVTANGVLYSQPDAVRKLAIMIMVNAAESNVDMVCDMQDEYETKADIEAVFAPLNEQALDMLEDHIAHLRRSLESFLRNAKVTAKVRRLDYGKEGNLADVFVELDVE